MSEKTKLSVILNIPEEHLGELSNLQKTIQDEMKNVGKSEDEFHVTVAVADDIDKDDVQTILQELKPITAGLEIPIKLGPLDNLENKEKVGVIYVVVEGDQLRDLNAKVKEVLEKHGGTFYYKEFKPHMTLCYLTDLLTEEQKDIVDNYSFEKEVVLKSDDLRISIKNQDEWQRVAYTTSLSKRV